MMSKQICEYAPDCNCACAECHGVHWIVGVVAGFEPGDSHCERHRTGCHVNCGG
jgi:hypothetical protein